jgi:hypothetical protein
MQKLIQSNVRFAVGYAHKNKTTQSNIAVFSQPNLCYALVRLFKSTKLRPPVRAGRRFRCILFATHFDKIVELLFCACLTTGAMRQSSTKSSTILANLLILYGWPLGLKSSGMVSRKHSFAWKGRRPKIFEMESTGNRCQQIFSTNRTLRSRWGGEFDG